MQKTTCHAGTLVVLRRFDGTSNLGICTEKKVIGTTNAYYYKLNDNEATSFVLCMRQM